MTEQNFINVVLNGFGACTSVEETYTETELLEEYQSWRATHSHRSPLKTDNKLSRQSFLTRLYNAEVLFWQQEHGTYVDSKDHKAFVRYIYDNVVRLKAQIRA
jgi:protein tyrosine/serine phosphatase